MVDPNDRSIHDQTEDEFICPYCGESGGYPEEITWTEFQGDEAHGGMVEFREECCTLCSRKLENYC